ncbi:hypothetical protein C9I89_04135 [Photobacterium lipolyticum]|uniref:Uncharacterized protein n=1 Tax=Photobacterium lipolyticum TaxID=266810 RepID=A0A2T3N308_9GAMM|nr:hypothetical protein C9I89_04135 [Photobacterium lipolyticum]
MLNWKRTAYRLKATNVIYSKLMTIQPSFKFNGEMSLIKILKNYLFCYDRSEVMNDRFKLFFLSYASRLNIAQFVSFWEELDKGN